MEVDPRIPPPQPPRDWSTPGTGATVALAIALFLVVFALREADPDVVAAFLAMHDQPVTSAGVGTRQPMPTIGAPS